MSGSRRAWPLAWILTAGAVFLVAGCDCGGGGLTKGKPQIAVDPQALAFGALSRGNERVLSLTVENTGDATLNVESITLNGPAVFTLVDWDGVAFGEASWPSGIVPPGVGPPPHKVLRVRFSPDDEVDFAGEIVIRSNAQNAREVTVPLNGSGSVPIIEVSPALLDFGTVSLDSSASLTLTITNRGAADLAIARSGIAITTASDPKPFAVTLPATDWVLPRDASRTLEVIYAPRGYEVDPDTHQVVPHQGSIVITSNDPDHSPLEVPLRGLPGVNLPPVASIKVIAAKKLDGTPLADPCAPAPTDTVTFEGLALDPEGSTVQASHLRWAIEGRPAGSFRELITTPDAFHPTFQPDLTGDFVVCLSAADPQGNRGGYDPAQACGCAAANADSGYGCPCVKFSALPREDIRVELTWEFLGPDLDLHLVAPDGEFCSPTRECRFDPLDPNNPNWTRTACVDGGGITTCRTPNCDPVAQGCLAGQECYDDGVAGSNKCHWQTCSGSDCYWDARNPDWGVPGDRRDDPLSAIDCTRGCRAENINLNNPVPGLYMVMVNYYEGSTQPEATVKIYFKGSSDPAAVFTSRMLSTCDTWNVALIDWQDHETHRVTYLQDAHSQRCCN